MRFHIPHWPHRAGGLHLHLPPSSFVHLSFTVATGGDGVSVIST